MFCLKNVFLNWQERFQYSDAIYCENSNIKQKFNREKQAILGEELMYSFINHSTQYSDGFYTSLSKLCVHVSNLLTFLTALTEL